MKTLEKLSEKKPRRSRKVLSGAKKTQKAVKRVANKAKKKVEKK